MTALKSSVLLKALSLSLALTFAVAQPAFAESCGCDKVEKCDCEKSCDCKSCDCESCGEKSDKE